MRSKVQNSIMMVFVISGMLTGWALTWQWAENQVDASIIRLEAAVSRQSTGEIVSPGQVLLESNRRTAKIETGNTALFGMLAGGTIGLILSVFLSDPIAGILTGRSERKRRSRLRAAVR